MGVKAQLCSGFALYATPAAWHFRSPAPSTVDMRGSLESEAHAMRGKATTERSEISSAQLRNPSSAPSPLSGESLGPGRFVYSVCHRRQAHLLEVVQHGSFLIRDCLNKSAWTFRFVQTQAVRRSRHSREVTPILEPFDKFVLPAGRCLRRWTHCRSFFSDVADVAVSLLVSVWLFRGVNPNEETRGIFMPLFHRQVAADTTSSFFMKFRTQWLRRAQNSQLLTA